MIDGQFLDVVEMVPDKAAPPAPPAPGIPARAKPPPVDVDPE